MTEGEKKIFEEAEMKFFHHYEIDEFVFVDFNTFKKLFQTNLIFSN